MTENEKITKYTIDDIKSIFSLFSKKADNINNEETTKKEETTNKEENSGSKYATKEDITKINNRIDELATKIDKLQKDNKEKTTKKEETKKEEDTSKTSENETTANKNIKSKEIPHTHDGINNQSYKHTNPEASLMTSLGRDQYGISKFKQNKNIIKGDE